MPKYLRPITGLLILPAALAAAGHAAGQEVSRQPDSELVALDGRVSQFLEGVSMGQAQTAYQELLSGSQLAKQDEALKELVKKTGELAEKYGQYRGFEQLVTRRVGSDLVLMKYLYKCENYPVVWYFTFYRAASPGETPPERAPYRVIIVRFDTELERLGP